MRQIILDTETTGLNPQTGDRLVEIGCIELFNRRLTGKTLHFYINPERNMPPEAQAIHGLSEEFLADQPLFASVADEISEFVKDTEIIIHNASFDLGFLDMEYQLLKRTPFSKQISSVIDTLLDARKMFPGKRNRLDDLCDRFGIRNDHRTLHGALLDAELLAEVYLAMTRGQNDLGMDLMNNSNEHNQFEFEKRTKPTNLKVISASDEEFKDHLSLLDDMSKKTKKTPIWH
ncbi:MAG: DNA polymerase III subunit epsilon [Betaproteobacteria bacterium]